MTTVLVTGVRGNTGRIVAPLLRARGVEVRGGSRAGAAQAGLPDGVVPVRFDWDDPGTWPAATDGADALYIQRPEVERAPELVGGLVEVAGPGTRVVLLSDNVHGDDVPATSWEGRVERAVSERARRWTLLRPTWFHQVFADARYFRDEIRDRGQVEIPSGGAAISFVDARDIAEVAVAALLDDGHDGRAHTLTGPDASSLAEVAARLTAVSGHPVRHLDTPLAEAVAAFAAGDEVDAWYVGYIDHVWAIMRSGTAARVSDDVERVLGRPARSLNAFIDEQAATWRRGGERS